MLRPGGLPGHPRVPQRRCRPEVYDSAFRLTLLVETATRTYSLEELSAWLSASGFDPPTRIDLTPPEKGSLVLAQKR